MFSKGTDMKRHAIQFLERAGFALVYMAALLARAAALHRARGRHRPRLRREGAADKAVDGAALGAPRAISTAAIREAEATRIFKANFPAGYMGTVVVDRSDDRPGLLRAATDHARAASTPSPSPRPATMPTTFMRLANFNAGERQQPPARHAAHGRPVAGARRVELDRLASGRRCATRRGRSSTRSTQRTIASR